MLNNLISRISTKPSAVIFPPAPFLEMELLNQTLKLNMFSKLPDDYGKFLQIADGLIYNGLELYGIRKHNRTHDNYTFPDLESVNCHYLKFSFFVDKVIIGSLSEGIIFYDAKSNSYAISDRINLRSHSEVNTFEDLLKILFER